MNNKVRNKVVIIGTGLVGATSAFAIMEDGVASEIVLIDIDKDRAEGEVMDLNHGISFVAPCDIKVGDYSDCQHADIIIIAAGANQKPGETRIDLARKNVHIFKEIVPQIMKYNKQAVLLVVTNPVDILTYVTFKISGLPSNRVIGSGTVLDSSRFRYLLGENCGVDVRNVHAYIIGEHGDSEVAAWSLANIAGIGIENYCPICKNVCDRNQKYRLFEEVRDSAYKIIEKKGATYYAVALAVRRIVQSILRNENSILTVSSLMKGYYGVEDVCLSLPTIVNRKGVKQVLELSLAEREIKLFQESAQKMRQVLDDLDIIK
ncbi:MAG: L-lactate dehydrogenase [Clostridia bacterium]|nr:L-lactate dehydrogenase [Clostridia bacterium]